ncbi:YpmS family protein [Ligilactobacillus sp. WILCCON 0076]|uniref:YpmS family protein n=1 Tax=Ligilactobacillus ubinensis TaxID=2876789 RepID=A0A9X2FIC7_9LACO|nr:YpmS family protein [Ligilactobacillus ubinensis]MCP0886150.1 YpmS family protein [Ligilactobacillus ubinensis]
MPEKKRSLLKKKSEKPINYWKWAFAILLALICSIVLFIGYKVFTPSVDQSRIISQTKTIKKSADIDVSVDKKQLTAGINYYLKQNQKKSNIKYRFLLDKSAILMGTTKILGQSVSFTLYSTPKLNKRGNIVLHAKSVSVGSLNAPASFVLRYVQNNYDLGKFATVNYKKSTITLNLVQVTKKQGIKVKGETFNLNSNKFLFKVSVPLK